MTRPQANSPQDEDAVLKKQGQRISLVIAGVAIFWLLVTAIGREYQWSQRTFALFDLIALAGFGLGIWKSVQLWRARRKLRDR